MPAARLELAAELDEVVDLAVGGEHERAIDHRLVAALEVDDREARLQEPERPGLMHAEVVGPTVGQRGAHTPQRALVGAAVSCEDACDAAHGGAVVFAERPESITVDRRAGARRTDRDRPAVRAEFSTS